MRLCLTWKLIASERNEKDGDEFYRMLETVIKLEDCMAICWDTIDNSKVTITAWAA